MVHSEKILEYLLCLEKGLATATFPDEFSTDRSARSITQTTTALNIPS